MAQLCKKCDTYLPEEDFSPSFRGKSGKYCNPCMKVYNRERYWAGKIKGRAPKSPNIGTPTTNEGRTPTLQERLNAPEEG